jgi:ubiquinone/menaquinone biosynthesis C-methylase UbiE
MPSVVRRIEDVLDGLVRIEAGQVGGNHSMSKSNDEIVRDRERMEWSAAAPGWKKYGKDMLKWMAPISDKLIESTGISIGQTVLDVATGTGQPALTIAKIVGQNGKVIGVDLSPEMIEVAKEEAASLGLINTIHFQVVRDESLSMFSDNTFDSVVCRNGLMFMPDPVKALKAFLRVLKPGGKASVTVWGSPDKLPVMAAVMNIVSTHVPDMKQSSPSKPGGQFSISGVDMLRDYFLKAGFSNFNAEKIEVTVAQTDTVEELWQGMTEVTGSLAILLSKLHDEKKLAIKNDVIDSLRKIFPSGGPAKFTGELILGTGTKPNQ